MLHQLCLLFLCGTISATTNFDLVKTGITEIFKTGQAPDYYFQAVQTYQLPHLFRTHKKTSYEENVEICTLCHLVFNLVVDEYLYGTTKEQLAELVTFLCVSLGVYNVRVCSGTINQNIDFALYMIDHYPGVQAHRLCGSVLQEFDCPTGDDFNWSINIPEGNPSERTFNASESFNILQISDIHYDPKYKANGNARCGETVCCQDDQGEPATPEEACGYWTDYRLADVPWYLVEATLEQTKTHTFDFVYYTGDIISHRVWQTSVENNSQAISQLYDFFKAQFDVPVFPVFGNHEPHPLNVWPDDAVLEDESLSVKWLFELAAEKWSDLIGENVSATVLKGGYYSVSPRPGFRVIGLNGNLCYNDNWWLIFDDVDPFNQLQWLADTLLEAERNEESVHILSHVPTGSECLKVWSREYRRIVERFASTITGQFNGHTHRDEFHVYYNSSSPQQAIGVAFNGASVTPYDSANPSYKVYKVDRSTYSLLDYDEYTFNLTLANSQPNETLEWYRLYSFVETYGVNNLLSSEVDKVLYKMAEDHSLLDRYFRFYFREGDAGLQNGCDETCQIEYLCDVATAQYGEYTQCDYFTALYVQNLKKGEA